MREINLTTNQITTLKERHKICREQKECDRIKAILLRNKGWSLSKLVREAAEKLNIELHYLPPYSPNLNPIERLWKVMNEKARNGKYFATAKLFREKIDDFFATALPNIADTLDSWINDNFQTFESEF